MSERKLRVGMIGVCGFGAHRRKKMRDSGLFELVAVYDHSAEAMTTAHAEDGAIPTESVEALLAVDGLEAIVVSTGARSHAELTIAALRRGLHVFVEKPLASTMDHGASAFSSSVKSLIDAGDLGRVVTFEATTAHSGGFHIKPGDWRASREHNPGGMLFQCGVHKLHELIYYFGAVRRIHAAMRYDLHDTETADIAICQVEFESGLIGSLNAYHITPCLQSMMITGIEAVIVKDDRPWEGEGGQWIQRIPKAMDGSVELRLPLEMTAESDECGNLRSFYRAVTTGGVPYPSALDGALALAPVFAAAESAETGAWVDIETFEA